MDFLQFSIIFACILPKVSKGDKTEMLQFPTIFIYISSRLADRKITKYRYNILLFSCLSCLYLLNFIISYCVVTTFCYFQIHFTFY